MTIIDHIDRIIDGSLNITKELNVDGLLNAKGQVNVDGLLNAKAQVNVDGSLNVVDDLEISGNFLIHGAGVIKDRVFLLNQLDVSNGITTLWNELYALDKSYFYKDLILTNGADISVNDGNAFISGNLDASNIIVSGNVTTSTANLNNLDASVNSLISDVSENTSDINGLLTAVFNLQTTVTSNTTRLNALEYWKLNVLEPKIDTLEDKIEALESKAIRTFFQMVLETSDVTGDGSDKRLQPLGLIDLNSMNYDYDAGSGTYLIGQLNDPKGATGAPKGWRVHRTAGWFQNRNGDNTVKRVLVIANVTFRHTATSGFIQGEDCVVQIVKNGTKIAIQKTHILNKNQFTNFASATAVAVAELAEGEWCAVEVNMRSTIYNWSGSTNNTNENTITVIEL